MEQDKNNWTENLTMILLVASLAIATALIFSEVRALPGGVAITYQYNETSNGSAPASRNDTGGYIYYANFNTVQQDTNWKAYVGNMTGSFTLDDSSDNTIYDWGQSNVAAGEVYVSRNDSISWARINCSNQTTLSNEDTHFGFASDKSDSINSTFNITTHKAMQVGTVEIPASECYATQLFVNDSRQAVAASSLWQQILLQDNEFHVVFATFIEDNAFAYDGTDDSNRTADFQIIVPENGSQVATTRYYFWAEI